jgi:hypothetical protein
MPFFHGGLRALCRDRQLGPHQGMFARVRVVAARSYLRSRGCPRLAGAVRASRIAQSAPRIPELSGRYRIHSEEEMFGVSKQPWRSCAPGSCSWFEPVRTVKTSLTGADEL